MKLDFNRIGLKFFFVTFAVEGRRQVLSRLVNEKNRPRLTPLGELVRAALRALHLVRPAIGVSDYVIMPDHVHFVMRIDCDRDRIASPLWLTHRLLDAVECAARAGQGEPPPVGEIAPASMARYLQAACAADDAAHGYAPEAGEPTGAPAPAPPGCAAAISTVGPAGGAGGIFSPSVPPAPRCAHCPAIFERSPYIELSFDSRQLQAIRRYIRLNPARKLWRMAHPDRFRRISGLRHPFLDPVRSWSAIGDATLFASPFLFPVRLTLKKSVDEHGPAIEEIVEKARRGFIPVSGFISPGEREALRRLKAEPSTRFIKLLPCALPPSYDPSAEDSRELAAGRMLILSGFSQTPALSAVEMRKNPAIARAFRKNCLEMNDLAVALCNAAQHATGEPTGAAAPAPPHSAAQVAPQHSAARSPKSTATTPWGVLGLPPIGSTCPANFQRNCPSTTPPPPGGAGASPVGSHCPANFQRNCPSTTPPTPGGAGASPRRFPLPRQLPAKLPQHNATTPWGVRGASPRRFPQKTSVTHE